MDSMLKQQRTMPYIETSKWKFEMDTLSPLLSPKEKYPLSEIKKDDSAKLEEVLRDEEEIFKIAQIQINGIADELETVDLPLKKKEEPDTPRIELQESEKLLNLREPEAEANPYLVLLNRLDEEEGVRTPSIEDKLKVAEDRLRLLTREFCSSCEELIECEDEATDSRDYLQPTAVQEALQPKIFEPSSRTPRTFQVAEFKIDSSSQQASVSKTKRVKQNKYFKKDFYNSHDARNNREKQEQVTQEELELLNSTSTKAFLKFLKERKKEPPKIVQEIRKKIKVMKKENEN